MARLPGSPVLAEKFLKIAKAQGCSVEEQSAYHKVTHPAQPNRRVYVAKSKLCHRIDLSGFTHPLAKRHPKSPSKLVEQWISFEATEAEVLRAFYFVVKDGLATEVEVEETESATEKAMTAEAAAVEEEITEENTAPEAKTA